MGLFGFGKKKEEVIDYTRQYKRQQANSSQAQATQQAGEENPMGFLGDLATSAAQNSNSESYDESESADDRRRRLAKRFSEMTERIEDLSNQIYRLSQRVELLERKMDVNR